MKGPSRGKSRQKLQATAQLLQLGRTFPVLAVDSFRRARQLDLGLVASGLAFTTVLSIVPLLAILFYVAEVFGGLNYAYQRLMPFLLDNLSAGAGEIVEQYLSAFIYQAHGKAVGWAGVAGLLLTSVLAYARVVKSFDVIWEVDDAKRAHHHLLRAIVLIIAGPILLACSIALSTTVAAHIVWLPYGGQLVAFALSLALYMMVYSLVPLDSVPPLAIAVGSLLPAVLLETAKYGYAIYTRKAVTYSAFYGSFAAVPLFLLWIYIAWYITLFGGVWVRTLQLHIIKHRTGAR